MIKGKVIKYRTYTILEMKLKEKLGIPKTDIIQSFEIECGMYEDKIKIKVRIYK